MIEVLLLCGFLCYADQNINVAVVDLEGNNVSALDRVSLSNRLRVELFNTGKFTVIERSQMEEILKEQGFQQAGCTSTNCAVEMGQLIGVSKIVLGSIDYVAGLYSVNIRLVDVATGKIGSIAVSDCNQCGLSDIMTVTIHNVARQLGGLSEDKTIENKTTHPTIKPLVQQIRDLPENCGIPASVCQRFEISDNNSFSRWAIKKRRLSLGFGIPIVAMGAIYTIGSFAFTDSDLLEGKFIIGGMAASFDIAGV